jgi:hypothetical protein
MARSRSKHQRKRMKIRQAWKKRRKTQKAAAKTSTAGKPSAGRAAAA